MDESIEKPVKPDRWESMSVNELIDEKNILFDRYYYLLEKQLPYAADVKKGIDKLDVLIAGRLNSR